MRATLFISQHHGRRPCRRAVRPDLRLRPGPGRTSVRHIARHRPPASPSEIHDSWRAAGRVHAVVMSRAALRPFKRN